MSRVRYGIIGIGRMGSIHATRLLGGADSNGVLTAVCDISDERIDWAKKSLKGVEVFTRHEDLISSGSVDAVVVAAPHYDHPIMGMQVLNAGKHLLIEKPAGVYTQNVRQLNELAESLPSQVFGIMYNQRTNRLYRRARELVLSGELGELKRINWIVTNWYRTQAYYDMGGWRGSWGGEGGGVLMNQAPHQLDLFQWLGGMPIAVRGSCRVGVGRDICVENDVTFFTRYENGATGVFVTSTHDAPGTNRLEMHGDGGRLVIEQDGMRETLLFNRLHEPESRMNGQMVRISPMPHMKTKVIKDSTGMIRNAYSLATFHQHTCIFRNFSRAVLYGEPLMAPGTEGIKGLTLANAAYLSSWLGEEITLPLNEAFYKDRLDALIAQEKEAALPPV